MDEIIGAYFSTALSMMAEVEKNQKDWEERILRQWEESKDFPRKKKKMVRKSLELEWKIASWSPFDF